jgi:DNA-binding NarL/FixJ family response regulator
VLAQGLTDAQVAERLIVRAHTVQVHLHSIDGKLEVWPHTSPSIISRLMKRLTNNLATPFST